MSNKEILEGEVVEPRDMRRTPSSNNGQSQRPFGKDLAPNFVLFNIVALLISWIPIFGLGIAVLALVVSLIRRANIILPVAAVIIGSISTTFFIIIAGLLSLVF